MPTRKKPSRRPRQPSRRRDRFQVNMLLSNETKNYLLAAAKKSGRTTSAEAAVLVENAINMNRILAVMGKTAEQIATGNVEVELRRAGYAPLRDLAGNMTWLPPGHPANPGRSGFEEWKPSELQAGVTDAKIEQSNLDKIRQADERPASFSADDALDRLEEIEKSATTPKKDDAA
jgi:hypothetical protein